MYKAVSERLQKGEKLDEVVNIMYNDEIMIYCCNSIQVRKHIYFIIVYKTENFIVIRLCI